MGKGQSTFGWNQGEEGYVRRLRENFNDRVVKKNPPGAGAVQGVNL